MIIYILNKNNSKGKNIFIYYLKKVNLDYNNNIYGLKSRPVKNL